MTEDYATAFARINAALQRLERAASNGIRMSAVDATSASHNGGGDAKAGEGSAADDAERHYRQLRARTQAALSELDAVIARTTREALG